MSTVHELHIEKNALLQHLESLIIHEKYVAILDGCNIPSACHLGEYELLAAWGAKAVFTPVSNDIFTEFKNWKNLHSDWTFGLFSYDLKNNIEALSSKGPDFSKMPLIAFFYSRTYSHVKKRRRLFTL